jgi:uncharacterized membrane protein
MRFVSFCPPLNRRVIECASNSANLYIVIITILSAIFTLYIVFVLFWLHVSFTVIQARSRKILEI